MSKIYELEQEILTCWQITDDLKKVIAVSPQGDYGSLIARVNILREFYNLKFEYLFQTLEATIKEKHKSVGE